ncbi:hypothetical protein ACNKHL_15575 [Shigella flexneri]
MTSIMLLFSHASAVQVLGRKMMAAMSASVMDEPRPEWKTAKDALQFGQDGHGTGFFFTEKPDAMLVMAQFQAITANLCRSRTTFR